jgi:hypothetical protein
VALAAAATGGARAVLTWIPVWRDKLGSADPSLLDNTAAGVFILLFVIGLRNSWNLLVEGTQETHS